MPNETNIKDMNIKVDRGETQICKKIVIELNDNTRIRISVSIDGKLTINKNGLDDSSLLVNPRTSNEIEIW